MSLMNVFHFILIIFSTEITLFLKCVYYFDIKYLYINTIHFKWQDFRSILRNDKNTPGY